MNRHKELPSNRGARKSEAVMGAPHSRPLPPSAQKKGGGSWIASVAGRSIWKCRGCHSGHGVAADGQPGHEIPLRNQCATRRTSKYLLKNNVMAIGRGASRNIPALP